MSSLEILKVDGKLTRIQHNSENRESCTRVLLYNHGFPDSSVTPDALEQYTDAAATGTPPPDHGYWSSKLPRKVCEGILKKLPNTAFVGFNTLGIPGSTTSHHTSIEDAPPEFFDKTLTRDLLDIQTVACFLREQRFPSAQMIICGMSTGAFLSLAYACKEELHPKGGLQGCWVLACVADIPSSVELDFSEEQRNQVEQDGFCMTKFFPYGAQNNPQSWRLGRAYLDSFREMPGLQQVVASLKVPLLLLHGEEDKHVPPDHTDRLKEAFDQAPVEGGRDITVVKIPKGNHFLSSTTTFNKALSAIISFIEAHTASSA